MSREVDMKMTNQTKKFKSNGKFSRIPVCVECKKQKGLSDDFCPTCIKNGWIEISAVGGGGGGGDGIRPEFKIVSDKLNFSCKPNG